MTHNEAFFELDSFALVSNTTKRDFPKLSYGNLKQRGKTVIPVDLGGADEVEGDPAVGGLDQLPQPVQGAIFELPKDELLAAVQQAEQAGIKNIWLHQGTDTPEVLKFCEEKGLDVRHGTCAVMYTQLGFSYHSIHKWIMKLAGKY